MEFKSVVEQWTDVAGKIRVKVGVGEESVIFKFNKQPTLKEVREKVNKYIVANQLAKEDELRMLDEEIAQLTEERRLKQEIK